LPLLATNPRYATGHTGAEVYSMALKDYL